MTQAWYPFYWSDYSGKTMHLTQGQHGAFMLFLRFIYTTERRIPHADRYRISAAYRRDEKKNSDYVLNEFFIRDGEFWYSRRADQVIKETKDKHQKKVKAGKAGGKANGKANAKQNQSTAKAEDKANGNGRLSNHNHNHIEHTNVCSPPIPPQDQESKDGSKRRTRIPADWQPSPEDIQYAQDAGLDPVAIRGEFVAYWRDEGSRRVSWSATWRNRINTLAAKKRGTSAGTSSQSFLADVGARALANNPDRNE